MPDERESSAIDNAVASIRAAPAPGPSDFQALAENLPALCWMATADGSIFWYNRRWYDFTGKSPAEMLGWGWRAVHHPDRLAEVIERWTSSIAAGTEFEMVFPLRRRDGVFRPFLTRIVPVKDAAGAVLRWFGINIDVGELEDARVALRESEARYRSAMKLGGMGAWEVDFVQGLRKWTPEGMSLFGLDLPGGIGVVGGEDDEFRSAMHPEDRHLQARYHELAKEDGAFPAEYRIVRSDGQVRWMSGYGYVLERLPDGALGRMINVVVDVTEQKDREQHARVLLNELAHRSKNLLAVVQAIAGQTGRNADSLDDFQKRFAARLAALAISQETLVRAEWKGGSLRDLVRRQLAPFMESERRLSIEGDEIELNTTATEWLGLAFHELTTNAIKYGSLSSSAGRIEIRWRIDRSDAESVLSLHWSELDGPPAPPPEREGFGAVLTKRMVEAKLSATVVAEFSEKGFRWSLAAPLSVVT